MKPLVFFKVTNTNECPNSPCRFRCLPSMYVAGFAKSGTTDMCSSLLRHPSINGYRKELYFWNQKRFMRNHSLGVFSSLFDDHARRFLSDSKLGKGMKYVLCVLVIVTIMLT